MLWSSGSSGMALVASVSGKTDPGLSCDIPLMIANEMRPRSCESPVGPSRARAHWNKARRQNVAGDCAELHDRWLFPAAECLFEMPRHRERNVFAPRFGGDLNI